MATQRKTLARGQLAPLLHLTYVLQQYSDSQLLPGVGTGLGQVRIMSVLSGSVAHSQRTIARQLYQTEANVSRQLRVMKSQGLVSIAKNKNDRRQRDVKLTAKGQQKYKTAIHILRKEQKQILKLLNPTELKVFERAAGNLLTAIYTRASQRSLFK